MTDAWSSTFYHVKKPCFPASYIAESSSQPAQSALHNLAFSFGSPTSAGGRKASVASPNPHSGSTIAAELPCCCGCRPNSVQKLRRAEKGAQSKKERLKKVGSTCIPLASLDRLSDVIMCDQFKLVLLGKVTGHPGQASIDRDCPRMKRLWVNETN
ncbi:hypothetical protein BLNAU_25074 [Blattamonas nauphoetae]|uniref:Uncharacterized protein n=1 Tax=Blattamonas nauphoetae TaxID=2049346 RepID=A0ABQ9WKZ8_9EUKA|nr:hypothetical protein BLNAU_25074 [Blattamonas nauphoetae]